MSDEPNKPLEAVGDAELEARVVAWVLGEASAFEAAELERMCRENPELELFAKRMRGLHGWLKEAEKAEGEPVGQEWRLAPERRQRVVEALGVNEAEPVRGISRKTLAWRAFFSLAACGMALLVLDRMMVRKRIVVASSPQPKMVDFMPTGGGGGFGAGKGFSLEASEEANGRGMAEKSKVAAPAAPASPPAVSEIPATGVLWKNQRGREGAGGPGGERGDETAERKSVASPQRRAEPEDPFAADPFTPMPKNRPAPVPESASAKKPSQPAELAEKESESAQRDGRVVRNQEDEMGRYGRALADKPADSKLQAPREGAADSQGAVAGGLKRDLAENLDALETAKRENSFRYGGEENWAGKDVLSNRLEAPSARQPRLKEAAVAEIATEQAPESTFSLHVSDASFQMARAAIREGQRPEPASVRVEEIYNGVDYGDPAPTDGQPVVNVTEQMAHPGIPERNLLRVGLRTGAAGRAATQNLNLTVLLDHSGSMEREDRREGVKEAISQLSSLLKPGDVVSVAGFARQPRLLVDRLPGEQAAKLPDLISQAVIEGGTNLEEGLKFGNQLAERQYAAGAQNRVVLFTDGAANLGDVQPEKLDRMVQNMRQQGIAFDAAGFGASGLNDRLLEQVTRSGNGRYYVVDRPEEAGAKLAKKLAGAFQPAAENVKVQVRFNSRRVKGYRLLGFEEHLLRSEDFRNDAVDAAELAAEEAGQAIYQIHVMPDGEGEVGEVRVRFWDVASQQMVERAWAIPYEPQAPSWEQAKPSMQLAGLAALLGGKLKGDATFMGVTNEQVAPIVTKVRQAYPADGRVEDLIAMIEALR